MATTLAMPSEAELSQLSKNDLIAVVQRAVGKLQAQGTRLKKLAVSAKDEAVDIGWSALGYGTAALAGAGVGYWMGSIQRNIEDGAEGYDEESLLLLGFEKDLVAALGGAVAAYVMSKRKETKQYAPYMRMASMGALASWAGRMGYDYGMTPAEEEGQEQTA